MKPIVQTLICALICMLATPALALGIGTYRQANPGDLAGAIDILHQSNAGEPPSEALEVHIATDTDCVANYTLVALGGGRVEINLANCEITPPSISVVANIGGQYISKTFKVTLSKPKPQTPVKAKTKAQPASEPATILAKAKPQEVKATSKPKIIPVSNKTSIKITKVALPKKVQTRPQVRKASIYADWKPEIREMTPLMRAVFGEQPN